MPQGVKYPSALRRKVAAEYLAGGVTTHDLAKKYKIGASNVSRWAKEEKLGIGPNRKKRPVVSAIEKRKRKLRAIADHANGMTQEGIAKKHGVDLATARKWIREDGTKRDSDRIEIMADALISTMRETIVNGIRELVKLGVQEHVDNIMATLRTRIIEVA